MLEKYLKIKKENIHPITVHIHDIKNPIMLPNARKLIVINTHKGKNGKIDSTMINKHAKIGANAPRLSRVFINKSYILVNNSFISYIIYQYEKKTILVNIIL